MKKYKPPAEIARMYYEEVGKRVVKMVEQVRETSWPWGFPMEFEDGTYFVEVSYVPSEGKKKKRSKK